MLCHQLGGQGGCGEAEDGPGPGPRGQQSAEDRAQPGGGQASGPPGEKRLHYLKSNVYLCAGSCEPGSRCRPDEYIFESGRPWGVGILE